MHQQFIQITNLTPEQFSEALRTAVRSELAECGLVKPPTNPEYLTRKEVAELLRISLVTVHKLSNEGVLQSRRITGRIRYLRAEVEAAMETVKNAKYKR